MIVTRKKITAGRKLTVCKEHDLIYFLFSSDNYIIYNKNKLLYQL
jgi:hypothetical protein